MSIDFDLRCDVFCREELPHVRSCCALLEDAEIHGVVYQACYQTVHVFETAQKFDDVNWAKRYEKQCKAIRTRVGNPKLLIS